MENKPETEQDASTEQKIKEAAKRVFTRKGYAATRTRDIAEESGYNIALLNYYFRSKEKLFDIIMQEHFQLFIHSVLHVVDDTETTLQNKIELLVGHYIDMLLENPGLPIFVLGAINAGPEGLMEKLGFNHVAHGSLHIVKQWHEFAAKRKMPEFSPLHIIMNLLALTIFPFISSPLLRMRTGISMDEFNRLMEERKKLIPMWINTMLG